MKKIKAREYARQQRISLFQVIKKLQKGELKGEQVEENGLAVQYVYLPDEADDGEEAGTSSPPSEPTPAQVSREELAREIRLLRDEVRRLGELVKRCCTEKIAAPEADR